MPRLAGLTLFALIAAEALSLATSSCGSNEVRDVYMALDTTGDRRRVVFYPDTDTFSCNADFVGDRKDLTVNAVLRQTQSETCPAAYQDDKCHPSSDPNCMGSWGGSLHPVNYVLSLGENVPGIGAQTLSFQFSKQTSGAAAPCGPAAGGGTSDAFPFPVGHYRCEIQIDGVLQGQTDFDIIYPGDKRGGNCPPGSNTCSCPYSPVSPGGNCFDYVVPGVMCPQANQDPNKACQCDQTGTWKCP